jgi:hypothetical protein
VVHGTSALKALAEGTERAGPMLRKLVAFSLSYRLLVLGLALAVAILGTWAFLGLPVDAYPNIAQTQVKIILKAPGMTPEEVESRVITPIETEMLGIPGQAVLVPPSMPSPTSPSTLPTAPTSTGRATRWPSGLSG